MDDPTRHELHYESGDVMVITKGSSVELHDWETTIRGWRYPFTADETTDLIAWSRCNASSLVITRKWGWLAMGRLVANGGAYEAGNPFLSLPFFTSTETFALGKMVRLISR